MRPRRRNYVRQWTRILGHPPNGPHEICYRCDAFAENGDCPECGRSDAIAPCAGKATAKTYGCGLCSPAAETRE
jgi:hypothetical protein